MVDPKESVDKVLELVEFSDSIEPPCAPIFPPCALTLRPPGARLTPWPPECAGAELMGMWETPPGCCCGC